MLALQLLLVIVQNFLHQKLMRMVVIRIFLSKNLIQMVNFFSQSSVSFFYNSIVSIRVTVNSSMVVTDIITVIIIIQLVIAHILIGSQVYLLH